MSTVVTAVLSERELVIDYLWGRILAAFGCGSDEEAQSLHRMMSHLERMTDADYEAVYNGAADADL